MTGNISKIQRFSVGDGPGIRTTVFLKGCPLHCLWCHNPETITAKPVLMLYTSLCSGCRRCEAVCPQNVHKFTDNTHSIDTENCIACGSCVNACLKKALEINGSEKTADEVMDVILHDIDFYKESGGGVTLSGGEPLLQHKFCAKIAKMCYNKGIDVLIDTSACVDFDAFQSVLPYADKYYADLKAANDEDYKKYTGGSFSLVIENITRLVSLGKDVTVRIPIIPKHNDTFEYALKMADVLKSTGAKKVDLLPFHSLCKQKYYAMGKEYAYKNTESLKKSDLKPLVAAFEGFEVKITN